MLPPLSFFQAFFFLVLVEAERMDVRFPHVQLLTLGSRGGCGRYLRLVPLLAASMAAYLWVLPAVMDGPFWNDFFLQPDYAECHDGWWRVLTFSNNWGLPDSATSVGCMSWTWCGSVRRHALVLAHTQIRTHHGLLR